MPRYAIMLSLLLTMAIVLVAPCLFAQDSVKQLPQSGIGIPELPHYDTLSPTQKTMMMMPATKKKYTDYPYYFRLNYDFFTTLMASFAENPVDPSIDKSNIYFYYNITLNNRLQLNQVRVNTYLFNEFGKRFYIDSVGTVSEDQYYFKNTFNYPIVKDKIDVNFMVNLKSQLWKHYDYMEDSLGHEVRYLYSSYYSPGYMLFGGGFTYNFWEGCTVELGIASGKITKIKNQMVFEERGSDMLFGIEKGNKRKMFFGLNLQTNILPKMLTKHLAWENYTQLFIPNQHIAEIKYYTLDFNNALHYLFLKYLRISIRTTVNYDLDIQEKPQIINQITVGFYLSNIIQ